MEKSIGIIDTKESELAAAMLASDIFELDTLIHPDLVFSGPNGQRVNKADDLAAHRDGSMKLHKLVLGERQIVAWNDTAVVVVDADLMGTFNGQDFGGRFRYTRVWRQESEAWRVIAGHVSAL